MKEATEVEANAGLGWSLGLSKVRTEGKTIAEENPKAAEPEPKSELKKEPGLGVSAWGSS